MGLEELRRKLEELAEEEAKQILEEAEKEAKQLIEDVKAEAKQLYERIKREGMMEVLLLPKQIVSAARMKGKGLIDKTKSELLERAFEEARRRVQKLPGDEQRKLLLRLVELGKHGVGEEFVVRVDPAYRELLKGYEVVEEELGDFGVIVESPDGSIRVDNTLSNLMERLKPELRPKVAKLLFGG